MVSFHNTRLPDDVEQGAQGGPEFKTRILELDNAEESRNAQWSKTRGSWDISYGISSKASLDAVIAFFYARWGRLYGFRFKDWGDYQIKAQAIGVGDASNRIFQIYKDYSSGGFEYQRTITRLVSGTVKVYVNGTLKTETTHYSVNYDTGKITFIMAQTPGSGAIVSVDCEFDVPVRFDVDKLDITSQTYDAIMIGSITLVELKSG